MTDNNIITSAEEHLLHTYNRFQIVLERGEGMYLYDVNGKEYLDLQAGIAVCALGYGNKKYTEALKSQIDKLMHTSNLYYSAPAMEAAEKLTKAAGMDRVFFTNSGTEAIEGLIKTARKYAFTKDGTTDHEIIAMEHSFHGRSMGALSVTGNAHYREAFEPLIGNIKFANYNDLESVKALVTDKTCAILLETVQGEGGIYPADPEFLKGLRALCDEKDILLMFDEIQCGMGRTGDFFAWQGYENADGTMGIRPDCMAVAKAIGNGVPVGAFLMTEKVAQSSMVPGDHGSTYGGNPLVCAAVSATIDIFSEDGILENVKSVAPYFEEKLQGLADKYPEAIKERRGRGFMQGLELKVSVGDVVKKGQSKGLLTISAGTNVLRMVPPLIMSRSDVDKAVAILDEVFSEISEG